MMIVNVHLSITEIGMEWKLSRKTENTGEGRGFYEILTKGDKMEFLSGNYAANWVGGR